MDYSLNYFLEEFNRDQAGSDDKVRLFKTRLLRRIKRFAIVDVEYFWENPKVLREATLEFSQELDSMMERFKQEEEYELCQVLKESAPKVIEIYNNIYSDKIKQVKNARVDETVER